MMADGDAAGTVAPPATRLRTRLSLAVADQAVSAGTNVLITVIAARSLGAREFGAFGVLYLVYLAVIGAVRALVGEPALVRVPHPPSWRQDALASGFALGLGAAVLISAGGTFTSGPARAATLTLAALLPAMVLQDVGRYIGFAARQPHHALRLDITWAVAQVVILGSVWWVGHLSLAWITFSWACSGAIGGLHAIWADGRVAPGPSLRWVRASWPLAWRYLGTFATTAGIALFTGLGLGVVAGVAAVGALRGAQVLFGPLNTLFTGAVAAVVPDTASGGASVQGSRRLVAVSGGLMVVAAMVTTAALALPSGLGRAFLGASWPAARELILPVGIVAFFGAVIAGADIGLRSARAARESLGVQIRLAPIQLVVPLLGAAIAGPAGYAWGLGMVTAVAAALWWRTFERFDAEATGA